MRRHLESLATILLVLSALAMSAAVLRREIGPGGRLGRASWTAPAPEYTKDWRDLLADAIPVADTGAPVKLVEFIDFECPACKSFQSVLRQIRKQNPNRVAVFFLHYPLRQHRFARLAARAAECAHDQGRFPAFYELLFAKQDSLGLKMWSSFAEEARVGDIGRFERCVARSDPIPRVEAGLALGKKFGVHATPTVIINGWRFRAMPTASDLQDVIHAFVESRPPSPKRR